MPQRRGLAAHPRTRIAARLQTRIAVVFAPLRLHARWSLGGPAHLHARELRWPDCLFIAGMVSSMLPPISVCQIVLQSEELRICMKKRRSLPSSVRRLPSSSLTDPID
ncbi:hypothetical protein SEVIR_5G288100v4 [Setaria viridis]|uniref:Uncharacterized protein n=2 Tax=Setaria TaxID=4554 RepID=A0A368R9X7_SETIT|nr:hypothetical protein SETIT_5G285300v2 [Setaria italica]TKW16255.1 hypothetical protein SEVIR_5G288100v2 [Setaria viridis]